MGCKGWTTDAEIAIGRVLYCADGARVERPLDPGACAARCLQGGGVHDLVGGLPELGVVEHGRGLVRLRRSSFPEDHRLIEAPAVQIRPDRALQVVDEAVDVAVWRGPVEFTVLVGDVAVKRRRCGADQFAHPTVTPPHLRSPACRWLRRRGSPGGRTRGSCRPG